jgi:DNA-binding transcriptional MerR regulator
MEFSIGEVSRLTGVPVKTIRYYSDIGLVPESLRTGSGYRRYDAAGLGRLELVRTLRDLGIDLAGIRTIADQQVSLQAVAGAHADAIDLHIRQLTLRRAVLRALARNGSRPEEVRRMTAFARASADEANRIMEEFLAAVFEGREDDPFAERMRAALPVLPPDPSEAQVDAWIELAGLVEDPSFHERVRSMVAEGQRRRDSGAADAGHQAGIMVAERAGEAISRGIPPGSPEGSVIVRELVGQFGVAHGRTDDPAYRAELADRLASFNDRRVERYWQLIGLINDWPDRQSHVPAYEWFIAGLRS